MKRVIYTVVVAVYLLLVESAAQGTALDGEATCPLTEADATSWCRAKFDSGGNVTADRWGGSSFSCVCNNVTSITIFVNLDSASSSSNEITMCQWAGTFVAYPDGASCYNTTGVCPVNCSGIASTFCTGTYQCQTAADGSFVYSCSMCNGRLYTINGTSSGRCTRSYSADIGCDPNVACSGHGCCTVPVADTTYDTCICDADSKKGHWKQPTCRVCESGYGSGSNGPCTSPTPTIQVVLSSIGKTWTMVLPNIAVLFLFVVFGVARRLNSSDRPSDLTGLRRANLSAAQVARRRQQSLFHSKYIPMRPAKSRSFMNTSRPPSRGPPAY